MFLKIKKLKNFQKFFLIFSYILSAIIAALVYYTGGTAKVYANLMYITISTVSSTNGRKRGVVHALFSSLLVGPFMPLDVSSGEAQEPQNWLLRMIIYVTISFILGLIYDYNKKYETYITDILTHDSVTKLKNMQALKQSNVKCGQKVIVSISVKGYSEMVSVFGCDFTYKIVAEFSKILKSAFLDYNGIELYKHEGMDFIFILTEDMYSENSNVTEKIFEVVEKISSESLIVEQIPIYIEIATGIASLRKDEMILEGVRHSLMALEHAKSKNIKHLVYDKSLESHYKKIQMIASSFRHALMNNDIKIASQNIYSSKTGNIHSVELLTRWVTKDGSRIYADEFIPVIEKTELMSELTKHLVDYAVEGISKGKFKNIVSINFSAVDFNDSVMEYTISAVRKNNIPKNRLQIEITESHFIDKKAIYNYLIKLNSMGIVIAIDDFGTGYSSYQYISELPIDVVKIDKSLIEKIAVNNISKSVVKSIIDFCKINNFTTVGEGVETKEIADICRDIEIDYLQGYYFHKPTIL